MRGEISFQHDILLMFVSHPAQEGLIHQTIKVYLSAILIFILQQACIMNLHCSLYLDMKWYLKKNKAAVAAPRTTIKIMANIKNMKQTDYHNLITSAACAMAFFHFHYIFIMENGTSLNLHILTGK